MNDYQTWARILLGLLAGGALAASGILYQSDRHGPATSQRNAVGTELTNSTSVDYWIENSPAKEIQHGTALKDQFHSVGGDVLIGGAGDDTYTLLDSRNRVRERPSEGIHTVESYSNIATVLTDFVENLVLKGEQSSYACVNAIDNIITAGDVSATLDGSGGNEILIGRRGTDIFQICAGNGSDASLGFTHSGDKVRLGGYRIHSFD